MIAFREFHWNLSALQQLALSACDGKKCLAIPTPIVAQYVNNLVELVIFVFVKVTY